MKSKIKNTKLFIFMTILVCILLGSFTYFTVSYIKLDKNIYKVEVSSVVYTDSLQYINTIGDATIEKKLDGNYYLYETNDGNTIKYKLGKNAIVYNSNDNYLHVYGDMYQINNAGEIVKYSKKSDISMSKSTKLFKLDDRKYLMVDSSLVSKNDTVLNTNNYLYIEIDTNGNASFSNDKLSFKTINPIIVSGSEMDFDIANEKLIYLKKEYDLKNIIGSTNNYTEKENATIENSDSDNEETNNKNSNSNSSSEVETKMDIGYYDDYMNSIITSVNNLVISLRNTNDTSSKLISQKTVYYDFNKWVALKSVTSDSSSITISYSVFDPNTEYDVVFIRITDKDDKSITYYLNKNNTSYTIRDLKPDSEYNLEFGYKTNNSNKEIIDDEVIVNTKKNTYDLKVTKISTKNIPGSSSIEISIYYTLVVDLNYKFKTANLVFTSNGTEIASETLTNDSSSNTSSSIITDEIDESGTYNGVLKLEPNVTFDSSGAENILYLDDVVICSSNDNSSCTIDEDFDLFYKFYNE